MNDTDVLRKNISVMEEEEIARRLDVGMFSDEARPIAEEELEKKRGAREKAEKEAGETVVYRLQFTGSGGEYFRIWIVNLLLSVLTLGIYSAWAKVRREQYFHRNTLLDGSGFDYHGNPKSILKGRIIAVAFVAGLWLVDHTAHAFYYPVVLALSPFIPWMMIRSFIFRSRNTSFRGLHFDFHGTYKGLCKTYLAPFIALIFLGWAIAYVGVMGAEGRIRPGEMSSMIGGLFLLMLLLMPMLLHRFKRFQLDHLAFGASRFESHFKLRSFYGVFLRAFVLTPALIGVVLVLVFALIGFMVAQGFTVMGALGRPGGGIAIGVMVALAYIMAISVQQAYFAALTANLVWNNTRLDTHAFKGDQAFWGICKVAASNGLFMFLTLGLYWPWAKVRLARYRASHTAVLTAGDFDDFAAGAAKEQSAIGEEIADIFDFDISL
ncbi:MAG: DUF898 domain-containing protein [Azoarcus sp.]|jgi:uncharacterized membrane protein YjgN (DUF898 family)|nr:DUF898 domain-containing protein [Azoarcus sp.]